MTEQQRTALEAAAKPLRSILTADDLSEIHHWFNLHPDTVITPADLQELVYQYPHRLMANDFIARIFLRRLEEAPMTDPGITGAGH